MRRVWVAMLLAPGVAWGQTVAPAAEFAAVLENPGHRQTVLDAAKSTPAWAHVACAAARFTVAKEVGVYADVTFDAAHEPTGGEWREGVEAAGCGKTMMLNVLTKVTATATLATGALLPGATITDPVLQNEAQAFVVGAAGGVPAGCADAFVADTRFDGYTGAPDKTLPAGEVAAPWRETWTVSLCGVVKMVTMDFVPGAAGVAIRGG